MTILAGLVELRCLAGRRCALPKKKINHKNSTSHALSLAHNGFLNTYPMAFSFSLFTDLLRKLVVG